MTEALRKIINHGIYAENNVSVHGISAGSTGKEVSSLVEQITGDEQRMFIKNNWTVNYCESRHGLLFFSAHLHLSYVL